MGKILRTLVKLSEGYRTGKLELAAPVVMISTKIALELLSELTPFSRFQTPSAFKVEELIYPNTVGKMGDLWILEEASPSLPDGFKLFAEYLSKDTS